MDWDNIGFMAKSKVPQQQRDEALKLNPAVVMVVAAALEIEQTKEYVQDLLLGQRVFDVLITIQIYQKKRIIMEEVCVKLIVKLQRLYLGIK